MAEPGAAIVYFPNVQRRILGRIGREILGSDLGKEYNRSKEALGKLGKRKWVTKDLNKLRKAIADGKERAIIIVGHGAEPDDMEHHGLIGGGEGRSVLAPQSALNIARNMVQIMDDTLYEIDNIWLWVCFSCDNEVGNEFVRGLGEFKRRITVYGHTGLVGQIDEFMKSGHCQGCDDFEKISVPRGA
ncbi:MAG: hypothetical protein MK102_13930 [Fuerstiella sp.]|nr:hypothetical protein [Fuerstiella sp.]